MFEPEYLTLTEAAAYATENGVPVVAADLLRAGTHGTLKLCASFGHTMWRIPTAFLLPIETGGSAQVDLAFHLDPKIKEILYPGEVRTIDQLRVMVAHLDEFLATAENADASHGNDGARAGITKQPALPALEDEAIAAKVNGIAKVVKPFNKLKPNLLDPAIEKAIALAGSDNIAAVWLKLKDLAISEERPFTGVPDVAALCYTDVNDEPATLTKAALKKRLTRRSAIGR